MFPRKVVSRDGQDQVRALRRPWDAYLIRYVSEWYHTG